MIRLYRYSIRTVDGQRHLTEATDAQDAIRKSGIAPSLIRPWYPMCLEALATEEEKAEIRNRLAALREKKRQQLAADLKKQQATEEREKQMDELEDVGSFWTEQPPCRKKKCTVDTTGILPAIPNREIPVGKLRPKKAQNEKPLALEMPAINAKQGSLF